MWEPSYYRKLNVLKIDLFIWVYEISLQLHLWQHLLSVWFLDRSLSNTIWTKPPPLQTRSWHVTHAHTSGCSPQIGSQAGHLARQLAALFVHAPHAVDKRREHTSRIWCSCHLKKTQPENQQRSVALTRHHSLMQHLSFLRKILRI